MKCIEFPVISRSPLEDRFRLNVTWTLTGIALKPTSITLQIARASLLSLDWTNITQLSPSQTTYWLTPSNLPEARDYTLRIVDSDRAIPEPNSLQPFQSGRFAVYQPSDLSVSPPLPAPSTGNVGRSSSWSLLIVMGWILVYF